MRFFLRYLSLEGKKSLIAARKSMVKFIVMLLLIAGGVLAVSLVMRDAGVFQTAEIGVVIPEDEAQTKMVAQFISAMDSVKSVCHFQYLDQDEAMASLQEGTLDAVLSLPEQFYEDVDSGKNTPATIYFPENAPLNTRVFGELVTDGVSLLRTAEAGVYAAYDTAQIYQAEISRNQIGDVISELYIYEAFDRTSVFQKFLMTVPLWLAGVLAYAVGCLVSGKFPLSFLWFDREVISGTLLLAAVIAAYFHLIYTISGESTRGTIVLLAVNVFQIMASGVVIPTAYLPEIFGKIGAFFPLAFWDSYYLKLLFFGIKGQETEQLLLMFCVFFAASVLWAKAAGHFGKVGWERHKKGGSLTVGGFGKSVFFNWYFLQLKAWLKRGTSLLLLVSMLFVVWFAGQISMPQSDNVTVGIVSTEGAHGKEVLEHLTQRESLFSFVMYDSKEALKEDVIAGKLECGFYFSSNFEKKFEHQKLKNSVSYLCTPLTTKGEVARETFYAALFEVYGAQMLGARTEQLFGDEANAACDVLLANNEKYLKGSEVFQVNVEQTDAVETIEKEKQVFPLHGLVALFLFLILFVEYGRRFDAGSGKPYLALPAPLGEGFQMMGLLAAGTVPAVTGLVLLLCSGESRGLLWEISGMILLLAVCIVWIWIVGKWIHNLTSFTSHMFFLVLINLVFCPVFVDIAAYIPALKFVRYLFPVGIYLGFISL